MIKEEKRIKNRKHEKGFGGLELLSVAVVCLIIAAVFLVIALQSSYNDKYQVMQYNATQLAVNATGFQFQSINNEVYLKEMIDFGAMSNVKNPFYDTKYCDTANSKLVFEGDKKYVTLKCGEYVIDNQYVAEKKFTIYKITAWHETKKSGDNQETILYNYKDENGNDVFKESYEKNMFLYAFNLENDYEYNDVEEIPSDFNVYSKTYYRKKTEVAKVDVK